MLNKSYILSLISPYLNGKREISEFEFFELFSELDKKEQYEVINIMIDNDIELVDEKEEEAADLEDVDILQSTDAGTDYQNLMHLTNEELAVMFKRGEKPALTALIEKNKKLVYKIASKLFKEYRQNSLTVDDLYMEGNMGIIEAATRFELEKESKFTTYAVPWIRQKIIRAIMNTGFTIRIPVHFFEVIIKVNNCRKRHADATIDELLIYLREEDKMPIDRQKLCDVITYSDLYMNTTSLNDVVGEDGDLERIELIPDDKENPEEEVIYNCLQKDLDDVLSTLSEREKNILDLRFGLSSGTEMTLEQVGEIYNVTRERIRQIEAKAIRKLRHPSRSKKISGEHYLLRKVLILSLVWENVLILIQ